jgi:hypothetical protein
MFNIVKKINKLTYRETVKQAHEENTLKETSIGMHTNIKTVRQTNRQANIQIIKQKDK